jgi:hypothetical protein
MKTKHVIVLEINKEHCIQTKNAYSCTYLTCILYYLNGLNVNFFFSCLFLEKTGCAAYSVAQGI